MLIRNILMVLLLASCATDQVQRSQKTIFWMDQNFKRYENPILASFLLSLVKRIELSAQSQILDIDHELLKTSWKIHLFQSNSANAFSAGSGNLILTKSIIQACENEAELASIIAHEMSHYYLAHSQESSSYSIEREIEADTLALNLIELAGYDVNSSLSALNILYRQGPANVSENQQENLNLRTENLTKQIRQKITWGITETREFSRIKKSLDFVK